MKKIIILFLLLSITLNVLEPIGIYATQESGQQEIIDNTNQEEPETEETEKESQPETLKKNDIFSKDVTYEYEYFSGDDDELNYGLFTPSTASENKSFPLIVWLHGSGAFGEHKGFSNTGLLDVMRKWSKWGLEGINAYILCPRSNNGDKTWYSEKDKLQQLLENIIEEKNIDRENIFMTGHSSGANGALYMVTQMPEYFSKNVLMSGFGFGQGGTTAAEYKALEIETRAYSGQYTGTDPETNVPYKEYLDCEAATKTGFRDVFGDDNVFVLEGVSHSGVPKKALTLDEDKNGRSDLFEWLFDDYNGTKYIGQGYYDNIDNVENPTTGLDLLTGMFLEPTVEFFTFVIDSVMSVFSGVMKQEEIKFVMVDSKEINTLPDLGEAGTTYTISNMELYQNVFGSLDHLEYPRFTFSPEEIFSGKIKLLDVNFINSPNDDQDWNKIRSVISQWYQVLRMIAIIGLLSVLIYIGIKIIISSTAKDKAQYKEMLVSWFVAVLLAFSMHYIMAFILSIMDEILGLLKGITGVIDVSAGGVSFETNLIGLARFQIQQQHFSAKVGFLIIYIALVVYTFKFTFLYLKRVLKMAFLTMISPIVALTYPIDKANDGKAQGFEMWLKEFMFNALLQPMHYILYYILVTTSLTLAARNPLYGIAALMFLSQAEKLLKKIFGFDKARAGTVGGIAGAFATGAITSSLMKHIKDPLHPFGGGKGNGKSGGKREQGINYNEETPYDIIEDTDIENFLGAGGEIGTVANRTPLVDDFISRYRQEIPQGELEALTFDDGFGGMQSLLRRIFQCQNKLEDMNLSDDERQKLEEKLFRLQTALQNRLEFNEAGFNSGIYPLQYTDGDTRTNSELVNSVLGEWSLASIASSEEEKNTHQMNARRMMQKVKRRMSENQYIQKQGGPQQLWPQEEDQNTLPTPTNNQGPQEDTAWKKIKNAHVTKGVTNVGKTLLKPVWDTEKGTKENTKKLVRNITKGVAGASVGVAAAAVQAGISITDGKYKVTEGIATVAAGVAGVSGVAQKAGKFNQEEVLSVKKYGEQWFNRDDVISFYNKEFPGQGKEMRDRAVKNYISRGITDLKDQKQAMKFAKQLQDERGMDQEEADKLAIATLQYKKNLAQNNNYKVLFDEKKKGSYLDVQADNYSGSASKASIKKLHSDFIENVKDFDRANR